MRRFFVGWAWLVLALALQGAAAGGLARHDAVADVAAPGDRAICRAMGSSDRPAPIGHDRHSTDCVSCQTCLGGHAPPATHAQAGALVGPRYSSAAVWPRSPGGEPRSPLSRSHRARAPPSLS